MNKHLNERYGPIIENYRLKPEYIKEFGNVAKIYTKDHVFALKTIRNDQSQEFLNTIFSLYNLGYRKMVPIYQTFDGNYLVRNQDNYYYLMPWLEDGGNEERTDHYKLMFKELANLHLFSSKDASIDKSELEQFYQSLTKKWDKRKIFLEQYIQRCEASWFMSPFELHFCTFYHETIQAIEFGKTKLDEWYEKVKEKETSRTVVTHGKVSIRHFMFDKSGSGSFISFENSKVAFPIYDLVSFYYRTLRTYPKQCDECIEWLETYQEVYPLSEEEQLLFLSLLSFPEPIYRSVKKHINKTSQKNVRNDVKNLQKSYWLIKNVEYFVMRIIAEQQKQEQQKQEQQKQEQQKESHT